jgi:RND family efflux transporter MFP subunit
MSSEPNNTDKVNIQEIDPDARRRGGAIWYVFVGAVALVAASIWLGVLPRMSQDKELKAESQQAAHQAPRVEIVSAHLESDNNLVLPGNIQAVVDVPIYARASGYIVKRYADIGMRVHKGQLLVDIESPEAGLQWQQAQADTSRSRATVVQSQSDVEKLRAGVAQAEADSARAAAMSQQSRALIVNSQSRLAQAKANKSEAEAKLAESQHALEGQKSVVEQFDAQLDLATATSKRYRDLLAQGFVTQQDDDQAQANLKIARANIASAKSAVSAAVANVQSAQEAINSAQAAVDAAVADVSSSRESLNASVASERASHANVVANQASLRSGQSFVQVNRSGVNSQIANEHRMAALSGFQQVRAPFDGVITARNVDVGSLVAAGAGATNQGPTSTVSSMGLFGLAGTDELRIQVSVPQAYFQSIAPGTRATVTVQELPGRKFEGAVTIQAGALDSSSRTRLTEIRLRNPKGILLPGMFAQIVFATGGKENTIRVPANALDVGAKGTRIAIVRPDNTLHYLTVQLGRDFGNEVEILDGLNGKEKLVSNPTNDLREGMRVEISKTESAEGEPGSRSGAAVRPDAAGKPSKM